MRGYKLTEAQAEFLQGKTFNGGIFFNPIKDKNCDYFIFNEEVEAANILLETTLIEFEFVPKVFIN